MIRLSLNACEGGPWVGVDMTPEQAREIAQRLLDLSYGPYPALITPVASGRVIIEGQLPAPPEGGAA